MQDARSELLSVASDLLHSMELPSPYSCDHEQKTYTANRLARMSEEWHEVNRKRAVRLREIYDQLSPNTNRISGERQRVHYMQLLGILI